MQLYISNLSLYALAQAKGYEIVISYDDNSPSKMVEFKCKVAKNSSFLLYTKEWEDNDIIIDCVPDLLKWAGLEPTITLEYR
jgi:hypothetical protein